MTSPPARTRATAGPYRPTPVGREGKMLSRQEAAQARRWRDAGWPVSSIARHLRRSPTTIRAYLKGDRQPGKRAPRPDTFLPFAGYSRRRFTDDPHLGSRPLFAEVTALGYPGNYQSFCRALQHHQVRQHACRQCQAPRPATPAAPAQSRQAGPLPIPVALIAGEVLASYLGRLAAANHITTDDLLTILPPWFNTKIRNHDDRSQHHMLAPALPGAILALAALTGKAPAVLARALPAFGARYLPDPARATTACRKCLAIRGIYQPVPVHRPACHLICSRHSQWLSAAGLPQLDLTESPEIVIAYQRSHKLLRHCTPQQLMIAHLAAERTLREPPRQPAGESRTTRPPQRWRHRLRQLKTTNPHRGDSLQDELIRAAIYPDALEQAAAVITAQQSRNASTKTETWPPQRRPDSSGPL